MSTGRVTAGTRRGQAGVIEHTLGVIGNAESWWRGKGKRNGPGIAARAVITLPPAYGFMFHINLIWSRRRSRAGWGRWSDGWGVTRRVWAFGRGMTGCVAKALAAAVLRAVAEPMPTLHALRADIAGNVERFPGSGTLLGGVTRPSTSGARLLLVIQSVDVDRVPRCVSCRIPLVWVGRVGVRIGVCRFTG